MMDDYESYHEDTSLYGDDPLCGEDELEDDHSTTSEQERAELEVMLYSQLHFEHNPDQDLTDYDVSGVILEEQVPGPPPDQDELNWRERLLGGLGRVDRVPIAGDSVDSVLDHTAEVDKNPCVDLPKKACPPATKAEREKNTDKSNNTKGKQGKKERKQAEVGNNKVGKLTRKSVGDMLDKEKSEQSIRKAKRKEKVKKQQESHLSQLMYRNEPENKVSALAIKNKNALNKVNNPKIKVIVMCTDSDNSDTDPPDRKKKKVDLDDLIIIDSITSSDVELGDSENPIILQSSSDLALRKIEAAVDKAKPSKNSNEVPSEDSTSSAESSDESVTEVDANLTHDDIQTNLAGRVMTQCPLRKPPTEHALTTVPFDKLDLENCKDLTIEDIHLSMGECDWGLIRADKYSAAKCTVNRYFKKLDVTCHNCKEKGHLSKICPKPKKVPVCLHCGIEGHRMRGCPRPVCFNCLQPGHHREDCTAPRRRLYGWCKRCGMQGHVKGDCTDLWRQYHMTTEEGALNEVEMERNTRVFCYNCAKEGHWGHECEEEMMGKYNTPHLPFIAQYGLEGRVADRHEQPTAGRHKENRRDRQKDRRTQRSDLKRSAQLQKAQEKGPQKKTNKMATIRKAKQQQKQQAVAAARAARGDDNNRGPPAKKRKTQNERFEAEYQAMVRNADNKNTRHNKKQSPTKNYPIRMEREHGGDFPRSSKGGGQQHGSHRQGQNYDNPQCGSKVNKRKNRGKRKWDDRLAHGSQDDHIGWKSTRYDNQYKQDRTRNNAKGGAYNKQRQKKNKFTSDRGFQGYI